MGQANRSGPNESGPAADLRYLASIREYYHPVNRGKEAEMPNSNSQPSVATPSLVTGNQ